jgi:hypothetical protein
MYPCSTRFAAKDSSYTLHQLCDIDVPNFGSYNFAASLHESSEIADRAISESVSDVLPQFDRRFPEHLSFYRSLYQMIRKFIRHHVRDIVYAGVKSAAQILGNKNVRRD